MAERETQRRPLHPGIWVGLGCGFVILVAVIAISFGIRAAILSRGEELQEAASSTRELQRVPGGVLRRVQLAPGDTATWTNVWLDENRLFFGVEHQPGLGDLMRVTASVSSAAMQGDEEEVEQRSLEAISEISNTRAMVYDVSIVKLSEFLSIPENIEPAPWNKPSWADDGKLGVISATPKDAIGSGEYSGVETVYIMRPGEKPEWEKLTEGARGVLSPDGAWVGVAKWEEDEEAPALVEKNAADGHSEDGEPAKEVQAEENGEEEAVDDEAGMGCEPERTRRVWYVVRLDGSGEIATNCCGAEAMKWEMVDGKATGLLLVDGIDEDGPWAPTLTRVALATGEATEISVTAKPKLRLGTISEYEELFMQMKYAPGDEPPEDEAKSGDVIALDMRTGKARFVAQDVEGNAPVSVLGGKLVILSYLHDEDSEAESAGAEENSGLYATKYVLLDTETGKSAVVKFPAELWDAWDIRGNVSVSPSGRRVAYQHWVDMNSLFGDYFGQSVVYDIAYPEELVEAANK